MKGESNGEVIGTRIKLWLYDNLSFPLCSYDTEIALLRISHLQEHTFKTVETRPITLQVFRKGILEDWGEIDLPDTLIKNAVEVENKYFTFTFALVFSVYMVLQSVNNLVQWHKTSFEMIQNMSCFGLFQPKTKRILLGRHHQSVRLRRCVLWPNSAR